MKGKIIGFGLWLVAFGSVAYSYYSGNQNYAGIGVAIAWISVIVLLFVILAQTIVLVFGAKPDKEIYNKIYPEHSTFSRLFGWVKTFALFIALSISGYWFTAVAYMLIAIIMACIEYCVRENEKNAGNIA